MPVPALLSLMAPAGGSPTGGMTILLVQVALIGLVFFFLIIRPQQQARKKHEELLAALKKGDEVMTAGGVIGRVRDIKARDGSTEVRVTLESGSSTLVVERSRIVRVGDQLAPTVQG